VANHAAGRGGSAEAISMQAIAAILEEGMARVRTIIEELVVSHGG